MRPRASPKGHVGSVQLVEIDGIDLNTCGGPHCASWVAAGRPGSDGAGHVPSRVTFRLNRSLSSGGENR